MADTGETSASARGGSLKEWRAWLAERGLWDVDTYINEDLPAAMRCAPTFVSHRLLCVHICCIMPATALFMLSYHWTPLFARNHSKSFEIDPTILLDT
jgi:hypothetical protein